MTERRRRRRRLPRQLRFTREGRVFLLVTLGVGAAAVNTGNNLLYLVLGLLLSLIVLSGVMSELVLRRLRVTRRLPRRAFANKPCLVELVLDNDKPRIPSFSVELEDVAPDEPSATRCYFLKVPAASQQVSACHRTPSRRGRLRLTEVVARTRYPFGLFEKSRVFELDDELIVYPALLRSAPHDPTRRAAGADAPTARRGPGSEVAGLRAYQPTDEARSIHWRRSASLGQVVVRQRQRDASRQLTLLIDEARPKDADPGWDARFEAVLSRAATAAADALEQGATVRAVSRAGRSPRVPPGRPPDPIWRFLALLSPTDGSAETERAPTDEPAGRILRLSVPPGADEEASRREEAS